MCLYLEEGATAAVTIYANYSVIMGRLVLKMMMTISTIGYRVGKYNDAEETDVDKNAWNTNQIEHRLWNKNRTKKRQKKYIECIVFTWTRIVSVLR